MDKTELLAALKQVDERLTAQCDVILIGGAAMMLHFGAERATRDIDVLVLRGNIAELRQATSQVGRMRGLPEDWLNDAAKGFADILPPDFQHRLTPLDLSLAHLHLYVLGTPDQVAMKIVALREQDLEDLELLLPQLSDEDRKALIETMHHVAGFRPDWAQKMRYFLLEQGWNIQ